MNADLNVHELRAIASAEAPCFGLLEADLSPIRFRIYIARCGDQHHLLVQGKAVLPDDTILHVACLFASTKQPYERYVLRGLPLPVREGQFAGILLNFPSAPRAGHYTVRVKFAPDKQPALPVGALQEEEWCAAAEIVVEAPTAIGSLREKRIAWQIEYLAAELAHIEDQLEVASRVLEEARSESQQQNWRLEVLLLHDLAVIYGRRLADLERDLETARSAALAS